MFGFKKRRKAELKQEFDKLLVGFLNQSANGEQELNKRLPGVKYWTGPKSFEESSIAKSFFSSFFGDISGSLFNDFAGLQSYFKSVYDYAAVFQIANTIAALPIKMFRANRNGEMEEIPRGTVPDAEAILANPNPFTTWYDYIEGTVTLMELTGAAFHEIVFPMSPKELFLLRSDTVRVVTNSGGISHFVVTVGSKAVVLLPEESFQIKYFNPVDFHRGFSPYAPMRQALENDFFINQFMTSFFENGANVSGLLSSQNPLQPRDIKNLKTEFEEIYQGASKAFKLLVLGGGMEFTKTGVNPSEADTTNLRQGTRLDILTGRGVPPILLGFLDGASYANANVQIKIYMKSTVMPKARKVEEAFNKNVFSKFGVKIAFDFSRIEELQEDKKANADTAQSMTKAGTFTIDEVRDVSFGFGPIPGGEQKAVPPSPGALGDELTALMRSMVHNQGTIQGAKSNLLLKRKQLLLSSSNAS